jgi:DNA helicase-2/ATP-dependent DNA helicase PcrA
MMRSTFGQPNANPASRFLGEIPEELVDWRRAEPQRSAPVGRFGFGRRPTAIDRGDWRVPERKLDTSISLDVGDRVNHDKYGLGTVIASDGAGARATVLIDFGSAGTVRLMLIGGVPLQKL